MSRIAPLGGLLLITLSLGACGSNAAPVASSSAPPASSAAPASAASSASSAASAKPSASVSAAASSAGAVASASASGGAPSSAAAGSAASKPQLPTSPAVNLKVGVQSQTADAPVYIANDMGYFKDVGLNVELVSTPTVNEQIAPTTQGQLQVSRCSNSIGCFNAFQLGTDMKIVADMSSAGKTDKSKGAIGLVVRQDLWDNGTIKTAKDLVGRKIYVIAGPGSGNYVEAARWLMSQNIDPSKIEWPAMNYPDMLTAMKNKGIEVAIQVEPLLDAGVNQGVYHMMISADDMEPTMEPLYLTYWSGIDKMGDMVGERFMVAYLRGVRDSINAFEYGVNYDNIIQIMTKNTVLKDPAAYRNTKYSWVDPNGVVQKDGLQADADMLLQLGIAKQKDDLSKSFDDHYRQFAINYLGEYKPPAGQASSSASSSAAPNSSGAASSAGQSASSRPSTSAAASSSSSASASASGSGAQPSASR